MEPSGFSQARRVLRPSGDRRTQDRASLRGRRRDMGSVGMLRQQRCHMPTHDAGKSCSNSSECESVCVAPEHVDVAKPVTGTCYHTHS